MLHRGSQYVIFGASDQVALHIDDIERRAGDGPCIDAIEDEAPQMLLHGFSEQQAFDALRRHSQDFNIKLADVARTVIERRGRPPPGGREDA